MTLEPDQRRKRRRTIAILLIAGILVYGILAVISGGIWSIHQIVTDIGSNSSRNECARHISADLDESFQHNIADLLDAATASDEKRIHAVLVRMKAAPNAADQINQQCPKSIVKVNTP